MGGHAQRDPALLRLEPETLAMQVRQEAATAPIVRMRDAISVAGPLPVTSQTRDINLTFAIN